MSTVNFSIVLLLYHIGEPTTANPTIYEPPNKECSSYYSDYNDWTIESDTGSFIGSDDNLYWIITADTPNEVKRWLFSVNTEYAFDKSTGYSNALLTIDINGNFNQDSQFYIANINPKFFISEESQTGNYIGISFGKLLSLSLSPPNILFTI